MKLVNILSSVIVENSKNKTLLREFSENKKNELLQKYSGETEDSIEVIKGYIDGFEKIQNGLPVEERNIDTYTYNDLKTKLDKYYRAKQMKKDRQFLRDRITKNTKDAEERYIDEDVKSFIDFVLPMLPYIDKQIEEELLTRPFLQLVTEKKRYLFQSMKKYLSKVAPNETKNDIEFYSSNYADNYEQIELDKPWYESSFEDIEHGVDGFLAANKDVGKETDTLGWESIPKVYEDDKITIFEPRNKEDAIKLACNRNWCISYTNEQNRWYIYRYDNRRTIFFILDKTKPFDDKNYMTVVLLDDTGSFVGFADKVNDNETGGGRNVGWNFIKDRIGNLTNSMIQKMVPRPLSDEEQEEYRYWSNYKPKTDNLRTEMSEKDIEKWLELNKSWMSESGLNVKQFLSLPDNLKKKAISLGFKPTSIMIEQSSPFITSFLLYKLQKEIQEKPLNKLTDTDISILNSSSGKKLKMEIKDRLISELTTNDNKVLEFKFPQSDSAKIVSLYGFDVVLDSIKNKDEIRKFEFSVANPEQTLVKLKLPNNFVSLFPNIDKLNFKGTIIEELPKNIGCLTELSYLNLTNVKIGKLPPSLINATKFCKKTTRLHFLNLAKVEFVEGYKLPKEFAVASEAETLEELIDQGYTWFSLPEVPYIFYSVYAEPVH